MHWLDCAKRALVAGSAFIVGAFGAERLVAPRRVFAFEPFEPRLPLSAAGLVDVGTQPDGGLSDKIVYIHGGHGYAADNVGGGAWSFQRGEGFEMIEDLGNVDQMSFLADHLFRAGATIVPMRPIGHQTNQVVLDNDDAGVSFVGSWSNSSSTIFYGNPGDIPYRFATTALTETAYARYQPNITQAGFYPVYAWTRSGSDRATDQLYRVNHSGGITEVTVNHRRVGNGLVYLGTYHFEAGAGGYVDISNRSSAAGDVVIADMIRFGNGLGDIDRGAGVSGLAREDELGLYWIKWHVDNSVGIPDSEYRVDSADGTANVGAPPRYSEYMNREQDGTLSDRVFVSFHSNAGGGRGVLGLYNGNNDPATETPNQFLLANTLGLEVNNDMVAQDGQFEHTWFNRGTGVTLDRSDIEFGEINNLRINNEFDATIVEVAFHDNQQDAELMRDPKVRDALARATYQGIVNYFRAVDGNTTPVEKSPGTPTNLRAESNAAGSVTLFWTPPAVNAYAGDAPDGFRIYGSTNGYGFDGGTFVAGGAASSFTLNGLDASVPYFFKVVAVNEGGESPASEVVAALPSGGAKQVLVVNGFDRFDRNLDPKQPFGTPPNTVDRVRPRESNSRDYVVQVAAAIHSAEPGVHVNSTSNEAVISGAVNLSDYDTVFWILGEESTADDTFNTTEQTKVEQFIAGGGNLFLSGAEIAWDLDQQNNGRTFFEGTLLGNYVSDDANTYAVTGTGGGIFSGLSFSFDNGALFYNAEFPDVINPQAGALAALSYGGGAGNAAIQAAGAGARGSLVMFGFPFETITTAANRTTVMDRVLQFFGVQAIVSADFNGDLIVDAADYVIWREHQDTAVPAGTLGDADRNGTVNAADYSIWRAQFGTSPVGAAAAVPENVPFVAAAAVIDEPVPVEEVAKEPSPAADTASSAAVGESSLVPQPAGALTGKIVYTSGGHGWQWNSSLNRYATDRPPYSEIVEDFGNQEQMTFYADYLLRAGATVVPMRPVGHQTNERVLDNDSAGVTYSGSWTDSAVAGNLYYDEDYGAVADTVAYRFASTTAGAESAVATYTPNIPAAGFYPVYTWVRASSNRTNQLYRIHDSGGVTEIRVDHSKVGNGWVYLGTYHFNAGSSATNGSVQISNQGTASKVVIADAIRFGNGMGDFAGGPTVSGYSREEENSFMWLSRAVGQGVTASSIIGTGNVSAPSLMAEYMNVDTNPFGTSVYIGFHSNGTTGDPNTATARGAIGLIDGSAPTPNQSSLALYTGRQINQDMQSLNGQFEHNWSTRTSHSSSGAFGEINGGASAEMDMTIIEVGFHDNTQDSQLMRDPKVRDQLARSTYDATLEYFDNFGGLAAPASQPSAPTNVRAVSNASGDIAVSWTAGPTGARGGTPTGFRVYFSRNGYGFYDYVEVAGAGTASYTIPAAQLDGNAYYFKVVAINSGGESPRSAVVGARNNSEGGANPILIVDGFDRFDRTQDAETAYAFGGDGTVDRVWARYNNSFDYVPQVGEAIEAYSIPVGFDSVPNDAVISGAVNLALYDTVVWILGDESTANDTFNATEQTKVEQFIAGGGHLFVTGTEIAFELDQSNFGRPFYENTLQGNYVSDDAGTYNVAAIAGGIFAGLSNFSFDNGAQYFNADTPDVIAPQAGAQAALNYSGGSGGNAAIQLAGASGRGSVVLFGFPFETITTAANRAAVMDRVLDFFYVGVADNADFNGSGTVDAADFVVWRKNQGASVPAGTLGDANHDRFVNATDYAIWQAQFGTSPAPGAAASVSLAAAVTLAEGIVPVDVAPAASIATVNDLALSALYAPAGTNRRSNSGPIREPLAGTAAGGRARELMVLLLADRHPQALHDDCRDENPAAADCDRTSDTTGDHETPASLGKNRRPIWPQLVDRVFY